MRSFITGQQHMDICLPVLSTKTNSVSCCNIWPKSKHHPCPFQRCRRTSGRRTTDCKGWGGYLQFLIHQKMKRKFCVQQKNLCLRWITYNESNSGPFFGRLKRRNVKLLCCYYVIMATILWNVSYVYSHSTQSFYLEYFKFFVVITNFTDTTASSCGLLMSLPLLWGKSNASD